MYYYSKIIKILSLFSILLFISPLATFSIFTHTPISCHQQKNQFTISGIQGCKTIYNYYTYDEMSTLLKNVSFHNTDIMSLFSIGTTWEGREIWAIKLSDNVTLDETHEPAILLMGAHHGWEKPSYEILIYFILHILEKYHMEATDDDNDGSINEDLLDGIDNDYDGLIDEDPSEDRVRKIVNESEIYIIPMVNPDGVEAETRKNCAPNYGPFGNFPFITSHGVDLNRNYDYQWIRWFLQPWMYIPSTCQFNTQSSSYRGEKPFSEKETQAISTFVDRHQFSISISYHTYGEYILYPWGYSREPPPDNELFLSLASNMSHINNYTILQSSQWYPTVGDADDWLYGTKGIISFTIELGQSRAPLDTEIVSLLCTTHTAVNLYVCEAAHNLTFFKQDDMIFSGYYNRLAPQIISGVYP